ncbi:large conductance mechanosensitive channel protein MscL [Oceanobacillus halophilus]|uniref:Large-conductance mechanosensitive channel n=1 Tax=Oceanobacillus halophilus TaxID=930130 RepID=A0A494ZS46_9BACI|nr:large conductance mechanosensitive channel protein MscL [Oceanobacillus halophilus]RKQ28677.1 large conductance mechanosensitive channel protein MscL [Oceanobacillus halophilus]
MGLINEFRQFMIKGSAVDMGVGVVLGAAFSGFIDSLVKDILLPPFGLLSSKLNFENMYISLNGKQYHSLAEAKEAGVATINYGLFISASLRFLIILFVVFLVIRQINYWKKPHQHPFETMMKKECPFCFTAIPSKAIICPNCSSSLEQKLADSNKNEMLRVRIK